MTNVHNLIAHKERRDAVRELEYANRQARDGIALYQHIIILNEALIKEIGKNG